MKKNHALFLFNVLFVGNCVAMDQAPVMVPDDKVLGRFFKAIRNDKPLVVESMVKEHPHVVHGSREMPGFIGESVLGLHVAAAYGHDACIKILLAHRADPNSVTMPQQNTPLHYIKTQKGALLLLSAGARVDPKNVYGRTPLTSVLFFKKTKVGIKTSEVADSIAQLLLKAGANINHKDREKYSLLQRAIHHNNAYAVDFLLRNHADTHKRNHVGHTPFDTVIGSPNDEIVQAFEKHGTFFFPGMTPEKLFSISFEKFGMSFYGIAFLTRWARVFACANEKKLTGICSPDSSVVPTGSGVICNQHGCIIQNVSRQDLEHFFTPSGVEIIENALIVQCKNAVSLVQDGDHQALEEKITLFPFVTTYDDCQTMHMMHAAIQKNSVHCLRVLLEHTIGNEIINADIFMRHPLLCALGDTFLHLAVFSDKSQAIQLLMSYNADCLIRDRKNRTPIEYAVKLRRNDCIAQLNELISEQCIGAFESGDYKKSKQLLAQIVDCNVLDRDGNALLHRMMTCLHSKTKKFINLLVRKGANPNLPNKNGKSPLWYLCDQYDTKLPSKTTDIFEALLGHGAVVTEDLWGQKNKKVPAALKKLLQQKLLQQKYDEEKCCICYEHPQNRFKIPCEGNHSTYICQVCYDCVYKKFDARCPLCSRNMEK